MVAALQQPVTGAGHPLALAVGAGEQGVLVIRLQHGGKGGDQGAALQLLGHDCGIPELKQSLQWNEVYYKICR